MKKTAIIIIALAVAIVLTAVVLVVGLVGPKVQELLKGEDTTYSVSYYLQPTTTPVIPEDTQSWVDINMIAGDLATATDSTEPSSETLAPIVIGTDTNNQMLTTIIYIDQNGNIVDLNNINNNKTTTQIDNDIAFDDTVATTDEDSAFSEYEINSSGVITNYLGSSKVVMIPSRIQGVTVTGIGANCFASKKITSVQIPATVKSIGAAAFKDCKNLVNVIFADQSVNVEIGNSAFKGCSSLKKINLPVTSSIGMSAFESCSSLKEIDIKAGTKNIGQYCFAFCTALAKITIRDEETVFNGVTTFQDHNDELIVYCVLDSNVEFTLKNYGLNTSPITG